ncbi:hypothetical protein A0U91_15650 (plasmid) [Acetobacter persici]|uniref:Uncharacterized protein n=1 Tax=Acetobacter persici TaxID=1076596 RepID=A0A1U9LJ68_9PROT|nr:hypothetical protein A0U91_15650 [Acetobacter persici]
MGLMSKGRYDVMDRNQVRCSVAHAGLTHRAGVSPQRRPTIGRVDAHVCDHALGQGKTGFLLGYGLIIPVQIVFAARPYIFRGRSGVDAVWVGKIPDIPTCLLRENKRLGQAVVHHRHSIHFPFRATDSREKSGILSKLIHDTLNIRQRVFRRCPLGRYVLREDGHQLPVSGLGVRSHLRRLRRVSRQGPVGDDRHARMTGARWVFPDEAHQEITEIVRGCYPYSMIWHQAHDCLIPGRHDRAVRKTALFLGKYSRHGLEHRDLTAAMQVSRGG